jgi:hypothetical protein
MELRIPFKAICINDSNRPDGIPANRWVKKGETYTVIDVKKLLIQGGMLGFKLEEFNIDDCFPYQFFSASRFGIPVGEFMKQETEEMLDKLLEEAKEEALIPCFNEDKI